MRLERGRRPVRVARPRRETQRIAADDPARAESPTSHDPRGRRQRDPLPSDRPRRAGRGHAAALHEAPQGVRQDRNGDPLDGVINLFDVAIVLAVGFLVAALTGLGMTDVLTGEDMTVVTNPGTDQMQVIVKSGETIETVRHPARRAGERRSARSSGRSTGWPTGPRSTCRRPSAAPPGGLDAAAGRRRRRRRRRHARRRPDGPGHAGAGSDGARDRYAGDTSGVRAGAPTTAPTAEPGKKGGG